MSRKSLGIYGLFLLIHLVGIIVVAQTTPSPSQPPSPPAASTQPPQAAPPPSPPPSASSPSEQVPVASSPVVDKPFTNEDVQKLVALGMGSDVVVAKINAASQVSFRVEPDDLVALKNAGVSQEAIAAMIRRSSSTSSPPVSGAGPSWTNGRNVVLRTKSGDIELKGHAGDIRSTGTLYWARAYKTYFGLAADCRTKDCRPSLVAQLRDNPKDLRVFLVRTKPDPKNNARTVRLTMGSKFSSPEEGSIVPYDFTEEQPGQWRLTPKADLEPGEYGLLCSGQFYDFGVDK